MTTATTRLTTTKPPADVLRILTDFGPDRATNWPGITEDHYQVHATGDDWAEVTEGNAMGWERERYEWDAAAGRITITTLDSNLWGPGSGWEFRLRPEGAGTVVDITLERHGKGLRGKAIGALLPLIGGRFLKGSIGKAIAAG